jgi:hypothetical protein
LFGLSEFEDSPELLGEGYAVSELIDPCRFALGFARRVDPTFDSAPWLRSMTAIQDSRWKLIVASDGSRELYDLQADPGESKDLSSAHDEIIEDLSWRLHAHLDRREAYRGNGSPAEPMPEATKQQLRSLGYLDSAD